MKILPLFCLFLTILSLRTVATTLEDLRPHVPSSESTWAEQWFYNISIPNTGYFKISLQTYIAPDFIDPTPKAYIHLAYTPLNGSVIKYDIFRDDLILRGFDDLEQFHYEVPGIVVANKDTLTITFEGFNFSMNWAGEHSHYWRGRNPGQTPFGIIPELPGVGGKWFLYTVGTPIQYQFDDGNLSLSGSGFAQLDKGWFDKESSSGVIYTMGLSDELYYMFTGARVSTSAIELWAGRYISKNYDLIFYPAIGNISVKREYDSCNGDFKLEMDKLTYKLILEAKSELDDFYRQVFPSAIIFGGEQRYMKSMKAKVSSRLYQYGQLVETIEMPQALLEFSGPYFCSATKHDSATR